MLLKKARLTIVAILFLVALRFLVGYHFYMEGVSKVREGNFSSKGFLTAAKGPLADKFHQLIPDFDGSFRLPELRETLGEEAPKPVAPDNNPKLTNHRLFALLDAYGETAESTFGFSEDQSKELKSKIDLAKSMIAEVVSESADKIEEHLRGRSRIEANQKNEMRNQVASMRGQKEEIEAKWRGLVAPTLAQIDSVLAGLEKDVNEIATDEQIGKENLSAPLRLPGGGSVDVSLVDKYIPIFDMVVGILLMIGLLTPVAGIAAGLFLLSVILTQFPGYAGTQPTYYQGIEMLACFLLAFTDAGRYAGLDFIPWSFWNRNRKGAGE